MLRVGSVMQLLSLSLPVIYGCDAQLERVFDNPNDPNGIAKQTKGAAPKVTPTENPAPDELPEPSKTESSVFWIKKLQGPFFSDLFEVKYDDVAINSLKVHALGSKYDNSMTFLSLERSKNLAEYFWRVNARKFELQENGFSKYTNGSEGVNLFPECNDPVQGNGVNNFKIIGILDKYENLGFSQDSLPDNLTHVKIEAQCRTYSAGTFTTSKTIRLKTLTEDSAASVKPLAEEKLIKCVLPERKIMVDRSGVLFDYRLQQQDTIPGNFTSSYGSLYLGAIESCFEQDNLLRIRTNKSYSQCYSYSFSSKSLVVSSCNDGHVVLNFQPFRVVKQQRDWNSPISRFEVLSGAHSYLVESSGSTEASISKNNQKIEPSNVSTSVADTVTDWPTFLSDSTLEQAYGDRLFAWSVDKKSIYLSNGIFDKSTLENNKFIRLTVDSPPALSTFADNLELTGSCLPEAVLTAKSAEALSGVTSTKCSASGNYSLKFGVGGSDGTKNIVLEASGVFGDRVSEARSFIKDKTPPSVNFSGPSSSRVRVSSAASYTVSLSDINSVASVDLSKLKLSSSSGVSCNKTTSGTGTGPFTVTIFGCTGDGTVSLEAQAGLAVDAAGNVSLASSSPNMITVDNTPPLFLAVNLTGPASDGMINSSEALTSGPVLAIEVQGSSLLAYSVVNSATTSCSPSISYSTSAPTAASIASIDGVSRKICIRAQDAAGNSSYALSEQIVIDKGLPTVSISSASRSSAGSTQTVEFVVTFSDAVSGVSSIQLDSSSVILNGSTSGCSASISGSGLQARTVAVTGCTASNATVSVSLSGGTVIDSAGNSRTISTSASSFTAYNILPTLTISNPSSNSAWQGSISLSGQCQPNLLVSITGDFTQTSPYNLTCSSLGQYSVSLNLSGADGTKQVTLTTTNSTAQTSTASRSFKKDTTKPVVTISSPSSPKIRQTTSVSYQVSFSDLNGVTSVDTSKIATVTTGDASCAHSVSGSGAGPFTVTISGCSGEGTIGVSVAAGAATDSALNASFSTISQTAVEVLREWYLEAYIKAANAGAHDNFGDVNAVSISGDTIVVGAPFEDSNHSDIINGSSSIANDNLPNSGAAYVYRRVGSGWVQEAFIKAGNAESQDNFGKSVSISGDLIAVGAPWEDSYITTITTSISADNYRSDSGAVYVYRREGTAWAHEAFIKAVNAGAQDYFGRNIHLAGDTLAVGNVNEDSNQNTITNGSSVSNNNDSSNSGAVYIYRRIGTSWAQEAFLKSSNADPGDGFGAAVSMSGDTLVVGAPYEAANQTTISTGTTASVDNSLINSGAVYVFKRHGNIWLQDAYLKPSNADSEDRFGWSVSVSGQLLAVGANQEDSNSSEIINGSSGALDNSFSASGAAYIYRHTLTGWIQEAIVKASNAATGMSFGTVVALSGNRLAVGAPYENSNQATITNGVVSSDDKSLGSAGAVYIYHRNEGNWQQEAYIKPPNPNSGDFFGHSLSFFGDTIAVGAVGEDAFQNAISTTPLGLNDNSRTNSGAVYVFRNRSSYFNTPEISLSASTSGVVNVTWNDSNLGKVPSSHKVVYGTTPPPVNCSGGTVAYTGPLTSTSIDFGATDGSDVFVRVCSGSLTELSEGTVSRVYVDTVAPTIESIVRGSFANPSTNNADVQYIITFSEPIVGLSSSNLSLTDTEGTGLSGSVQSISCMDSATCTVNVRIGGNAGKLRLDVSSVSGVTDFVGNQLATTKNGDEAYTVEGWYQEAFIKASNADAQDLFGSALAMSHDTLVVGASYEDSSETVITNGLNSSEVNTALQSGAVYVYRRAGNQWSQEAYIKASNSDAMDYFGGNVSISGDTLVVGAPNESSNQTTITNGETSNTDNSLSYSGAVYVYRRNGVNWSQEAFIKASNAEASDRFGSAVSVNGDTLAVGAPSEDSNQNTITNGLGSSTNNLSSNTGAVYVYAKTDAGWSQQAYIKSSTAAALRSYWDGGDYFGQAIALSGDTLAVGQPGDDSPQNWITNWASGGSLGSYTLYDTMNYGSVSVFRRQGNRWAQEAYIKPTIPSGGSNFDYFGETLSLSGDRLAVGVRFEDSNSTTITATAVNNDLVSNSGATYLFKRSGNQWAPEVYIKAANSKIDLNFGRSVSLSGDTLAVGACDSSNQSGVLNSALTSSNSSGVCSGAVYVFKWSSSGWAQEAFVKPAYPDAGDNFGLKVALLGDTLAVSAVNEDSNQRTITNGPAVNPDNLLADSGAVYVFRNRARYFDPSEVNVSFTSSGDASVSWNSMNIGKAPSVLKVVYGTTEPAANCTSGTVAYFGAPVSSASFSVGAVLGANYFVRVCAGDSSTLSTGIVQRIFVDNVAPEVSSIVRGSSPNPTLDAQLVTFVVTFSEPITGLSASNFTVVDAAERGLQGTIENITCAESSATCSVAVRVNGNAGKLRLDLTSASGITDFSGNSLQSGRLGDEYFKVRGWYQEAYVKASNARQSAPSGSGEALFGASVSASGDTLAIGAKSEDSNQTTITNGTGSSSEFLANNSGSVFVYRRSNKSWMQEAYIKAANAGSNDLFGNSVSLSGETLAVGADGESSFQTSITNGAGASTDDSATAAGAVYVYRRNGVNWAQEAYIKAANANSVDYFGGSVSLSGNTLAVGAREEDSNQTTITNGTTASSDNSASYSGAVYVYRRSGVEWAQEAYIKARAAISGDSFGHSVSLSGDTLAVGAPGDDSNSNIITNGDSVAGSWQGLSDFGAVYVYRRSVENWTQEAYIKAVNLSSGDEFGSVVTISGDTLVVGVKNEDSNQNSITNGLTASSNNSLSRVGAVYVYRRSGVSWAQEAYIKAANANSFDYFGTSVSLSGDTLAVGATGEDSNLTTITNGTAASANNSADGSGAVYLYRRTGVSWAQEAYIKAVNANTDDVFGSSVSLSGDSLAVGAYGEDSNQTTITNGAGASSDNSANGAGAVYVYRNLGQKFDPHIWVSSKSSDSITLAWHSNLGETNRVKVAPASLGTSSPVSCDDTNAIELNTNVTSYTYAGLSPNTKYGFRVCSFDGTDVSQGSLIWEDTLPE